MLFKWMAVRQSFTIGSIGRAAAIEGVEGFAVILNPDIIHINKRNAGFTSHAGKNPVTFVIFAESERRTGKIDEQINWAILVYRGDRLDVVIVTPTILAK